MDKWNTKPTDGLEQQQREALINTMNSEIEEVPKINNPNYKIDITENAGEK